jgi:iron-sulfur cluster assembly accessory protein
VSTLNITITDKAAELVKNTMAEIETEDPHLFIYVSGGGCSGLQYGMAVSEGEPEIDDIVVYSNDIKIVVEGKSAKYLDGAIINYKEDGLMSGFKIENPNAEKSCGCGSSFSVEGETYDSCGGCGYK